MLTIIIIFLFIILKVRKISPNGFGISDVAGVPPQRDERPFRVFRVMRCRELARRAGERRAEPELFPKPLCRKGASDPEPAGEGIERFRHNVSEYLKLL